MDYLIGKGFIRGVDFISQYFVDDLSHPYLADIYIPPANLIIESEADYWHDMGARRDIDSLRTAEMIDKGMRIYRVTDKRVDKDFDNVMKEIFVLMEGKDEQKV